MCESSTVEFCVRFVHKIIPCPSGQNIVVFTSTVCGFLKSSVWEKKLLKKNMSTSQKLLLSGVSAVLYNA